MTPHPIDILVGRYIKKRRVEIGVTQTDLAEPCKVTYQMIQKYEKGLSRVSASMLWTIASVLKVPVEYFFEGAK